MVAPLPRAAVGRPRGLPYDGLSGHTDHQTVGGRGTGVPALVYAPVSVSARLERQGALSTTLAWEVLCVLPPWGAGRHVSPFFSHSGWPFFFKERSFVFYLGNKKQKQSIFPSGLHD